MPHPLLSLPVFRTFFADKMRQTVSGGTYLPLPPPNKTLLQRSPSTGEDSNVQRTCVRAAQELWSSCAPRNGVTPSAIRLHWTTLRVAIRSVVWPPRTSRTRRPVSRQGTVANERPASLCEHAPCDVIQKFVFSIECQLQLLFQAERSRRREFHHAVASLCFVNELQQQAAYKHRSDEYQDGSITTSLHRHCANFSPHTHKC